MTEKSGPLLGPRRGGASAAKNGGVFPGVNRVKAGQENFYGNLGGTAGLPVPRFGTGRPFCVMKGGEKLRGFLKTVVCALLGTAWWLMKILLVYSLAEALLDYIKTRRRAS